MSCAMPCDFLLDGCLLYPFAQIQVADVVMRNLEYPFINVVVIRLADQTDKSVVQRNDYPAPAAMVFCLLLLESQCLGRIIHIAVGELTGVAPTHPGVKPEDECTVNLRFLAFKMCRNKLLYFLWQKNLLLKRHVVVLQHKSPTWIFLDEVFVNGSSNHTLEHSEIDFRTVACSVLFQILNIGSHHVIRQLCHLKIIPVERISRRIGKKVLELLKTVPERYAGVFSEGGRFDELVAELEKILVHVFSEAIALPVLKERLLTFKTYLFSKGNSILVLHTLLLVAGMKPYIQI